MTEIGITLLATLWLALDAGGVSLPRAGPLHPQPHLCAQRIFAGSVVPLHLPNGATAALLGPGSIEGAHLATPAHLDAPAETLVIAERNGVAGARRVTLLPAPALTNTLASVDADCGITLYDRASLTPLGTFVTDGSPADAAYSGNALIWAPSSGSSATRYVPQAGISPLALGPDTSALLDDRPAHVLVQANRDTPPGSGAVTIIADDPRTPPRRLPVGETPEGLALTGDAAGSVLVTAVNGGTLSEVDPRADWAVRTLRVGERPFGVAADTARGLAFVALNAVAGMRASTAGGVAVVDLRRWRVRRVRHDAGLALGVAVDPARRRIFVTEELGSVLVLDEELRPLRVALHPCELPWLPSVDLDAQHLFIPCPREDRVVVYDLRTLREVARMKTSPYPLRVVLP
ncbi:hypothetical protein EPN44_10740 [bacterium]|nr:MAG: hypothetical protein EPN44_10740 [bacterium]